MNLGRTTISVGQDREQTPTTYRAPAREVGLAPTTVLFPPERMRVQYGIGVQAATSQQHVSNPHPYVHPYINNQVRCGVQSIPPTRLMAQHPHKYEYGEEVRAPSKVCNTYHRVRKSALRHNP